MKATQDLLAKEMRARIVARATITMEEIRRDVGVIRDRMARLEALQESHGEHCKAETAALHRRIDNEVASRYWVREELQSALKPVTEAVTGQAAQIAEIVHLQKNSEQRLAEFHATQNKAMQERTEGEERERQARIAAMESANWKNVLRKWWVWVIAFLAFFPALVNFMDSLTKLGIFK